MKTRLKLSDLYCADPIKACRLALRRTAKICERDRLERINDLLGMHGTEALRGNWQNGYWCDIVAAYANTGDSYAPTVIHLRGWCSGAPGRFFVSSWGDFVESPAARQYGIE
jgi:hypothetical protein